MEHLSEFSKSDSKIIWYSTKSKRFFGYSYIDTGNFFETEDVTKGNYAFKLKSSYPFEAPILKSKEIDDLITEEIGKNPPILYNFYKISEKLFNEIISLGEIDKNKYSNVLELGSLEKGFKTELESHIERIKLKEFKEKYFNTEDFKNWYLKYHNAKNEYHKILKDTNFEAGKDIPFEILDKMFGILRNNYSHNQSLNKSILTEHSVTTFNSKLRKLYFGKEPFPVRINEFLILNGISAHTVSEFLVVKDEKKFPLSSYDMKKALNLEKSAIKKAKQIALKRFDIEDESKYQEDTIDYLTFFIVYEEIQKILNTEDLYQINMILWRFGKVNQLKAALQEYKQTYLEEEKGRVHLEKFSTEKDEVNEIYNEILENLKDAKDITDKTINYLLPLKRESVSPAGVSSISAYGIEKKDFPAVARYLLDLIKNLLININNEELQKKNIIDFISSGYQKGIQQGLLSPVLHYLNDYYLIINSKIRDTVKFISKEVFNNQIKLADKLEKYIDANQILKEFLTLLSGFIPEFSDFNYFNAFCHWMCEESLGGYVKQHKDFIKLPRKPVLLISRKIVPEINIFKEKIDFKELFFENGDILERRITNAISNGKHLILIGPPGTGKSKLAKNICESYCGKENYIMTTATSDWSTFDTIGGYKLNKEQELEFSPGLFLKCFKSDDDKENNKWLILDEINRADIDKAFGSLFSALTNDNITISFEKDRKQIRIVGNEDEAFDWPKFYNYYIPEDWRIIATMNTYDKSSLYEMSYAFMRRFAFIPVNVPKKIDEEVIKEYENRWRIKLKNKENLENIAKLWSTINAYRKIGPAIIEDICKFFIKSEDYCSILIMYVFPQFEGLAEQELIKFIKDLLKLEFIKESKQEILNFIEDFFGLKDIFEKDESLK